MNAWRQALGWTAALAVVPLVTYFGGATTEPTLSPLADVPALAAAALATWPLAALLALTVVTHTPRSLRIGLAIAALVAGALLISQLPNLGAAAGRLLEANRAGWAPRFAVRGVLCLVVQWLGIMAAIGLWGGTASPRPAALVWAMATAAALLLPWAHSGFAAQRGFDRVAEYLTKGRIVAARRELALLQRSGVWRKFRGVDVEMAAAEIDQEILKLARECSVPLPARCRDERRIDRARRLAQLDQTFVALAVLDPVRYRVADASLLAGAILQQRGAYSASDAAYHRGLELLPREGVDRAALGARVERAYNALAFNAREVGHYDEVPALFAEARAAWPDLAPAFDEQLGRHYHQQGRAALAQRHFDAAAAADPARFGDWRRTMTRTLDFHGLLTLCSLGGATGRAQVGSMEQGGSQ